MLSQNETRQIKKRIIEVELVKLRARLGHCKIYSATNWYYEAEQSLVAAEIEALEKELETTAMLPVI